MNKIVEAHFLSPNVKLFKIEAPKIAQKRKAGQFVMLAYKWWRKNSIDNCRFKY